MPWSTGGNPLERKLNLNVNHQDAKEASDEAAKYDV